MYAKNENCGITTIYSMSNERIENPWETSWMWTKFTVDFQFHFSSEIGCWPSSSSSSLRNDVSTLRMINGLDRMGSDIQIHTYRTLCHVIVFTLAFSAFILLISRTLFNGEFTVSWAQIDVYLIWNIFESSTLIQFIFILAMRESEHTDFVVWQLFFIFVLQNLGTKRNEAASMESCRLLSDEWCVYISIFYVSLFRPKQKRSKSKYNETGAQTYTHTCTYCSHMTNACFPNTPVNGWTQPSNYSSSFVYTSIVSSFKLTLHTIISMLCTHFETIVYFFGAFCSGTFFASTV